MPFMFAVCKVIQLFRPLNVGNIFLQEIDRVIIIDLVPKCGSDGMIR